jgi:hypothetical protein
MDTVDGKNDQNGEIRNQDGKVEGVGLINAAKRILVEDLVEINADGLCHRICGSQKKSKKKLIHGIVLAHEDLPASFTREISFGGRSTKTPTTVPALTCQHLEPSSARRVRIEKPFRLYSRSVQVDFEPIDYTPTAVGQVCF